AYGQSYLVARNFTWLVITHKGPLQNGDWSGEHTLYRLMGKRLRIFSPVHRHRMWTGHVSKYNWRLYATAAVTLDPTVLGEGEAGQLLSEVFHHVVPFKLPMDQY